MTPEDEPKRPVQEPQDPVDGNTPNQSGGGGDGGGQIEPSTTNDQRRKK